MPRSSKLQLSPTALTFTAGVLTGLTIGVFAGYAARGMISDDPGRERVEQQDIWNPYGTSAPIEAPLEVLPDAPAPAPALDDWGQDAPAYPPPPPVIRPDDPNAAPVDGAQADERGANTATPSDGDPDANTRPANPLGLDLDDDPSPANPTVEHVKPGGLRVDEDPDASYDAPAP